MKKILKSLTICASAVVLVCTLVFSASAALIGGDGGFYYSLKSDNTATLEEYHGSAVDIVIPSEVYSYTVKEIADDTFSNNTSIKSVAIPNSVKKIGAYAFYGCSALESAVISSSVTELQAATFYNCTSLKEVTIPVSVTSIAANAFTGCNDLTIKGERGSYAETYAAEHGIGFESTTPPKSNIFGDIDNDSSVTSSDALAVLRMSVGMDEYGDDVLALADIDGDSQLTSSDALELLRYSVGMSDDERIGQPV